MKKNNMVRNTGITLISLVIIIIILLILSGVSIGLLMGENGLISNSSEARTEIAYGELEEIIRLAEAGLVVKFEEKTIDNLKKELDIMSILGNGKQWIKKNDTKAELIDSNSGVKIIITIQIDENGEQTKNVVNLEREILESISGINTDVIFEESEKNIIISANSDVGIDKITIKKDSSILMQEIKNSEPFEEIVSEYLVVENGIYEIEILDKSLRVKNVIIEVTTIVPKLADLVNLGDYVEYVSGVYGASDEWRILHEYDDGTIEIIPVKSNKNVTLRGLDEYKRGIEILNNESKVFLVDEYTISSRAFGTNPVNPTSNNVITNPEFWNDLEVGVTTDENYLIDYNAYNLLDGVTFKNYSYSRIWMASRFEVDLGSRCTYGVTSAYITINGLSKETHSTLHTYFEKDSNSYSNERTYTYVPVIKLKSEIYITEGNGKYDTPYKIAI